MVSSGNGEEPPMKLVRLELLLRLSMCRAGRWVLRAVLSGVVSLWPPPSAHMSGGEEEA